MPHDLLTLEPDTVRNSSGEFAPWVPELVKRVREAAMRGETVTVSASETMFTPEQLAQRLNVSRSTISRRIKAGEIHAVKVGNRHRILYAEYERIWQQMMEQMADHSAADIEAELFGE